MAHTFNPSAQGAKADGTLIICGEPGTHRDF